MPVVLPADPPRSMAEDPPWRHGISDSPPTFHFRPVRTRLVRDLHDRSEADRLCPIETIIAPNGWGKTVVLAEFFRCWTRDLHRPGLWLGLREPGTPMGDVMAGLSHHSRRWSHGHERHGPGLGARMDLSSLARLFDRLPKPYLICLDNADHCDGFLRPDTLDRVLAALPPHVHLVTTASRALVFDRVGARLQGRLREHQAPDLAFTHDEAQDLMTVAANPADLEVLLAKTEGWAAGLRLCAVMLERSGGDPRVAKELTGDIPDLRDWFDHHVLRTVPSRMRDFLRHASLFPSFSADQIAGITGLPDASAHLDALLTAGMFIQPVSATGQKYRFHRLFRDRLRADAIDTIPQSRQRDFHRRRAHWALREGEWLEALDAAVQTTDDGLLLDVLETAAPPLVRDQGRLGAFVGIVDQLLARGLSPRFEATYWYIFALTFQLRHVSADRQRRRLETLLNTRTENAFDAHRIEHLRIALAFLMDDMDEAGRRATDWLAADAPRDPFDMGWVLSILSVHHLTAYRFAQARDCLLRAAPIVREGGSPYLTAWCDLISGTISLYEGNLPKARDAMEAALAAAESSLGEDAEMCDTICAIGSKCALEMGDYDRAGELLHRGLRSMDRHGTVGSTACAVETALAFWDGAESAPIIHRLRGIAANYAPRLAVMFRCHMLRRLIRLGRLAEAGALVEEIGLDVRQGRLHNQTGPVLPRFRDLLLMTSIEYLHATGDTPAVELQIERAAREARADGRILRLIRLDLVHMSVALQRGNPAEANRRFHAALRQSHGRGVIHAFQPHSRAISELLQQVPLRPDYFPHREARDFLDLLLTRLGCVEALRGDALSAEPSLREPLTRRENELMQMVGSGMSNATIADLLGVSENTIKWHLRNVFRKLGCPNRTTATLRYLKEFSHDGRTATGAGNVAARK